MKRLHTRSATPPRHREVRACELDQIRGGTIVISDPGPGDGRGPKVTGGTETDVVVIGGKDLPDTGPK